MNKFRENELQGSYSNFGMIKCLTDFDLTFDSESKFNSPVKAGQMVLDLEKNETVATGIITKTCYVLESEKDHYNYNHNDLSEYNEVEQN